MRDARSGTLGVMEIVLDVPDEIARQLAGNADVSRSALEAIALEGYRSRRLTLHDVSQLLGLSRIEAEDFLGRHEVALASYSEADLNREADLLNR